MEVDMTRRFALLFLAMAALVAFPAGAPADDGVTDTSVRVGVWHPLSGPAVAYAPIARAMEAYFRMVNENGGIHGRKVELVVRDDAYTPARTVAVVKELIEKEKVFAFLAGLGTPTNLAVMKMINDARIPHFSPATGSSVWAHPEKAKDFGLTADLVGKDGKNYYYALQTNYITESVLLTRYTFETLKKTKVAIIYQNDPFGKEGLFGVRQEVQRQKATLVAEVSYETGDTDLSSQALKLKQSGADAVILWTIPRFAAQIVKEMAKVGYRPSIVSSYVNNDPTMFRLTCDKWDQAANKCTGETLWQGALIAAWTMDYRDDDPGVEKYRQFMKKYLPNELVGGFTLAGYVFAESMAEALKRAGKTLNRDTFMRGIESIKNWNGDVVRRVTFGPNDHQGIEAVRIQEAHPEKIIYKTDWIE
jgi:branched-chain amino acid transport system substrate-binding protein